MVVVGSSSGGTTGRPRAVRFADVEASAAAAAATTTTSVRKMTVPPPPPTPTPPQAPSATARVVPSPPPSQTSSSMPTYKVPSFTSSKSSTAAKAATKTNTTNVVSSQEQDKAKVFLGSRQTTLVQPPPKRKVTINYLPKKTAPVGSTNQPPAASTTETMNVDNSSMDINIKTVNVQTVPETDISALSSSPSPMKKRASGTANPLKPKASTTTTVSSKTKGSWKGRSRSVSPSPPPPPPPPPAGPPPAPTSQTCRKVASLPSRKSAGAQMKKPTSARSPSPPPPPPRLPGHSNIKTKPNTQNSSTTINGQVSSKVVPKATVVVSKDKAQRIRPSPPPPPPPPQKRQQQPNVQANTVTKANEAPTTGLSTSKVVVPQLLSQRDSHESLGKATPAPPPPPQQQQATKSVHFSDSPPLQINSENVQPIDNYEDKNGHATRCVRFEESPERQGLAQSTTNISLISKGDDPTMDSLPMATNLLDVDYGDSHPTVSSGRDNQQGGTNAGETNTLNLSISQDNEHSSSFLDGEFLVDTPSGSVLENSFGSNNVALRPNGFPGATKQIASSINTPSQALSKIEKERLVRSFQAKLDSMKKEKQQLKLEFEKIQQQHDSTKLQLRLNEEEQIEKDQQVVTKIAEYQSQVSHSKRQVIGERTKRTQCEQELQMQNTKNTQLRQDLQDTEEKLKFCQNQYSQLKVDLLKATRSNQIEPATISPQGFVAALSEKVKTLAAANGRMSKIIDDAYKAIRARDSLERQLKGTVETKERLEKENLNLVKECEQLKKDVKDSQNYIDHLLQTSNETKKEEWEKREQQYKRAIHNLNQRILQQGTVVSFSVYKDDVEEGKRRNKVLQHRVSDLEKQILKLQQEKEVMSRVFSPKTKSPAVYSKAKSSINSATVNSLPLVSPKSSNEKEEHKLQTSTMPKNSSSEISPFSPVATMHTRSKGRSEQKTPNHIGPLKERDINTPSVKPQTVSTTKSNKQVPIEIVTCSENAGGTSNWWESKENDVENKTPGKTLQKTPSHQQKGLRRSPLDKVRALGGRLALKKKLDNCRSPRQVQTIIHC